MMITLIAIGLAGTLGGGYFFSRIHVEALGSSFSRSGTIFLLDVAIGLEVGAGMTALFYHMAKQEEHP